LNHQGRNDLFYYCDFYVKLGLVVVPLLPRSKIAKVQGWTTLSSEELTQQLGPDDNIGIRLDELTVLDIEKPELWSLFFKEPPEVIGQYTWICRTGGGGYHVYFRGETQPCKAEGLAELRSSNRQYVVVPLSIHPDTGRRYEWISNIEEVSIGDISGDGLLRLKQRITILKRHKPLIEKLVEVWQPEHRHELSLGLSGVLRKINVSVQEAELVIKAVALLAHDPEVEDRLRALRDTYSKPLNEVAGWSKLKEQLIALVGPDGANELFKVLPRAFSIEVKPLSEVIAEARPIEWIIENLIPKYGLVILAGKAGTGKSFLSLHLAHSISSGENFLGILPVASPGKVLIIDGENYPGIYKQRVEALKLNPLDGIDVVVLQNFYLDQTRCLKWLEEKLKENCYSIVIFDAWTNLIQRIDENKSSDVGRVLSRLRKLSYEYECCVIVIHHLRKNLPYAVDPRDELRGSSVLMNEADIVMLLDNLKNIKILKTIKQRYGKEQAFEVQFDKSKEKLSIRGKPVTVEETQNEVLKALEAVIEYLETKGNPATRMELLENLPFSEPTIKRALSIGINLGRILRVGRGIYTVPQRLEQFNAQKR
jgi:archaellum biogenesis ATPase FlaH